ncbi:MAG: D-cysteine desulfhydrase family protein [Parvibaculaceae bacterium]
MSSSTFTITELRAKIDALPRYRIARLPTPLDHMPRMSKELGIDLFVKREDMSGLAFGGNKTRELDFFIGDALQRQATVFIAGGGAAQSNHAVQCAAAARRAGLHPVMVLHRFRDEAQGNVLLNRLMDVDVRFIDGATIDSAIDARTALEGQMHRVAREYERRGESCYVLPTSFHVLGAAAYVDGAIEIVEQMATQALAVDHLYLTSAGATQVGLALGLKMLGAQPKVTGISYTAASNSLVPRMIDLGRQVGELLGLPVSLSNDDIRNESYAGPGYGIVTPDGLEAIRMAASLEGMFLDPVYSGKGMAGLIDHVRRGIVRKGERVVFVHTGGLPAIFAYHKELARTAS